MNYLVIPLTLLAALMLDSVPLPAAVAQFRPDFATLLLIYWILATPRLVGIGSAWVVGVLQDVLGGGWLGLHALAKSAIAYITLRLQLQIQIFPPWQQMVIVLFLAYLDHAIVWLIHSAMEPTPLQRADFLRPLTSALFWPLVYLTATKLRQWAQLA